MGKIKTFCAGLGLAAMLFAAPAFATEQKYAVPKYDVDNPTKTVEVYQEMTVTGSAEVAKENLQEGKKYSKQVFKLYDRDKDGDTDLVRLEAYQPEVRGKDVDGYLEAIKQAYGEEALKSYLGKDYEDIIANKILQAAAEAVYLAIDEEFNGGHDGFVERILADVYNDKGEAAPDGIFDKESVIPLFVKECGEIDTDISVFISKKLQEYT